MKKRRLSDSEKRIWAHIAKSVTPLTGRRVPEPPSSLKKEAGQHLPSDYKPSNGANAGPTTKKPAPIRADEAFTGISKADTRRIRRGNVVYEGKLDLHGMTQDEARIALQHFLTLSQAHGKRCVLVVTGKGKTKTSAEPHFDFYTRAPGVLKARFPDWITTAPLRSLISGYEAAHQRHGGEGAYYVFLRKKR